METENVAILSGLEQRRPFRLLALEVYNWGPFAGLHRAEIDPDGTAIIGMTGSGKTTLVDAFVTLLTDAPKYNLASTGGHESDRDLMSYVRGKIGSGHAQDDTAHISRKGGTTTGLCATYFDGVETVRCAGLLWIEGISSAYADLKRAWIFSRDPAQGLENWLQLLHDAGLRGLKHQLRDSGTIQIFDAASGGKTAYLARLRAFFEVGENAFALLNRAAGLKQLNSIDELFREFVLEDKSSFARAAEVAKDFDNLTQIHGELLLARDQRDRLLPVKDLHERHLAATADFRRQQELKTLLPAWFALNATRLWTSQVEELKTRLNDAKTKFEEAKSLADAAKTRTEALHAIYLRAGGQDIESVRALLETKERERDRRKIVLSDYLGQSKRLGFSTTPSAETLAENQARALSANAELEKKLKQADDDYLRLGGIAAQQAEAVKKLQTERQEVAASPGSNLPGDYQRFRAALAARLGLSPDALPFVAELVQVKPAEAAWRGAIERALGGHRLRLLVPVEHTHEALRWINHRDNQLDVRTWEADAASAPRTEFLPDGFARKLEFKPHALAGPLRAFLATHDLHCVDSIEALRRTPHALTREGAVSARKGYAEKRDRTPLDEGWCTGFDNQDRLQQLDRQIAAATAAAEAAKSRVGPARQALEGIRAERQILAAYAKIAFADIDAEGAERECVPLRERLAALLAPDSDTARAKKDYESAKAEEARLRKKQDEGLKAHAKIENTHASALASLQICQRRLGAGLSAEQEALAREALPIDASVGSADIDDAERKAGRALDLAIGALQREHAELEKKLVLAMSDAKAIDNGPLAEAGKTLADVPAYLERLDKLVREDLPAKTKRFLEYLNKSSDEGVTQLLNAVKAEADRIAERVDELNRSLERVDFKEGCFLRLNTRPVEHESVRALDRALKQLRSAMLRTDDQGEGHYASLKNLITLLREAVDKPHTVGAKALLDARHRLEFSGVEIDRATRREGATFKGSQGGSGGEKEIIASYILTASLSYALSARDGGRPLHATIVLDEAFSKSSRTVARRIAKALDEFGLHPIFVTPNKEVRLLRAHTRSVVHVHRKDQRSLLACVRWEDFPKSSPLAAAASPQEPVQDELAPAQAIAPP